mmetsp:Transcript_39312/g.92131  ORF Transcript_39312/g.92131 Transcript_39312/m.92131 type:complete len:257 (-) Transcript_39312:71-841(-)
MCSQDDPDGMVESAHPWVTSDVEARMPHEDAAQGTADGHGRNVVAGQRLNFAASLGDEPQLGQNCNGTDEETCHPQGVKDWSRVHVGMKGDCQCKASQYHRSCRKRVLLFLISVLLLKEQRVQQPEHQDEGHNVHRLVGPVARCIHRQVAIQPQSGGEAEAQSPSVQRQSAGRDASASAGEQNLHAEQGEAQALEDDRQCQDRRELAVRDEVVDCQRGRQKDTIRRHHLVRGCLLGHHGEGCCSEHGANGLENVEV